MILFIFILILTIDILIIFILFHSIGSSIYNSFDLTRIQFREMQISTQFCATHGTNLVVFGNAQQFTANSGELTVWTLAQVGTEDVVTWDDAVG